MSEMVYYMMASDYLTPKMMEKLISEKTDNVVFSPYSVISLIALLLDATDGKTKSCSLYEHIEFFVPLKYHFSHFGRYTFSGICN